MDAPVTIETSHPDYGGLAAARWATLKIMGIEVFTARVYDTDPVGNRTDEQAAKNMLHVLGRHLQRLDDES